MRIKDLPREVRPREKARQFGIESLSDIELLALLIGSGVKQHSAIEIASELLKTYQSISTLSKADMMSLNSQKGLSVISSLKLLGVFEIHKRLNNPINRKSEIIKSSLKIYERYAYLGDYDQEVFVLVMLNEKCEILREKMLYVGTSESMPFNLKEIITQLLLAKTRKFYMIHNHPDGSNFPSKEDKISTSYLQSSAEDLEIYLLDHLIITKDKYFSFKENKLL